MPTNEIDINEMLESFFNDLVKTETRKKSREKDQNKRRKKEDVEDEKYSR